MPSWLWIEIGVVGAGVVVTVLVLLSKLVPRVKEFRVGKTAYIVGGTDRTGSPLSRALERIPSDVEVIRQYVYGRYLRMLKERGVNPIILNDLDDSKYVYWLLRYAVSGGNGTNSVQKIIEGEVVSLGWDGDDPRKFTEEKVVPRIVRRLVDMVNSDYENVKWISSENSMHRTITNVEFYEMLTSDETRSAILEMVAPFFVHAKACLEGGCKE